MNNRGNYNHDSYLPSEDYASVTPEAKDMWRKLPSVMKDVILKGKNSSNISNNISNNNKSNNYSYKPFLQW